MLNYRTVKKLAGYYSFYGAPALFRKAVYKVLLKLKIPAAHRDMPRHFHIDTTNRCNLHCEYCVLRENMQDLSMMDLPHFQALGPYLKYAYSVMLSGLAEPLMNPQIIEFVRYIKNINPGCRVVLLSNATLLDEKLCCDIVDAGLDGLCFSIDGISSLTHDSIRKGSSIEAVLKKMRKLKDIKEQRRSRFPVVSATTVLQKKNYHDLPGIINAIAEVGAKQLSVNGLEPYAPDLTSGNLWYPPNIPADLDKILEASMRLAKEKGLLFNLALIKPAASYCREVANPYILPNGDVTACPVLAYDRKYFYTINSNLEINSQNGVNRKKTFGNVFEKSFSDIWRGREYSLFRRQVMEGAFPSECTNCLYKHGIICIREYYSGKSGVTQITNIKHGR